MRKFGLNPDNMTQLLQNLPVGTRCRVVSLEGDTAHTRRLMELGMVPGVWCTVIRKAPFGGPLEVALEVSRLGVRPTNDLRIYVEA